MCPQSIKENTFDSFLVFVESHLTAQQFGATLSAAALMFTLM